MKFKNLERNILYLLGNEWLKSRTLGSFNTRWIFDNFSDIPDKNMFEALCTIKKRGLVELTSNDRNIALTQKGLSKIDFIQLPENGLFPVPKQL
jgi:hypothetical protein